MSTRAMASQYMAQGGHNSAAPQGLDLFGIQHRRQLETMRVQTDLQKEVAAHQAELDKDIEAAREKMAEKLRNNSTVVNAATQEGIPVDKYVEKIVGGNVENAQAKQQNEYRKILNAGDALNPGMNPAITEATKRGANIAAMGLDPNKLNTAVPLGSISQTPNIPGVPMDVLKGGTTRQTPIMYGGFKDPKTGQVIDQKLGERNEMMPGSINRALPPMSQDELPPTTPDTSMMNSTMPNGNPSLTAGTFMNDEAERNPSPTPANQQPRNGIGSALTPQWPPRSGLIPGGYDVLGGLGKNYMQQMGNELAPFLKMLMGAGFTPQQQNTATPQY